MEELVFASPTKEIWKILTYKEQGLIFGKSDSLRLLVQKGLFRKRGELEADQSFKQIIPYAVISHKEPDPGGFSQNQSFYLFKRRPGQREKRLQNLFSLGVGGHMNPRSSTEHEEHYLKEELKRELFEEVRLSDKCSVESIEFIGFINDDTIPVGRVHLGLLYIIYVSKKELTIKEADKMTAAWVDKPDLADFYKDMETWTRIIFDCYINEAC